MKKTNRAKNLPFFSNYQTKSMWLGLLAIAAGLLTIGFFSQTGSVVNAQEETPLTRSNFPGVYSQKRTIVNTPSRMRRTQAELNNQPNAPQLTQTFSNTTPILINDATTTEVGTATPYPSEITVAGLPGNVTDVNVTLNGFTHTFPDDTALMLVAPDNKFMVIQSDAGGGTDATNVTYTLDDDAAAKIPTGGPLVAGTFQPSSYGDDDFFPLTGTPPPPADCQPTGSGECPQAGPAGTATLDGTFSTSPANGIWRLYVIDYAAGDEGEISGGWSITITVADTPVGTQDAPVDMNGDGKTDYVVVRNTGGGPTGQITWFVQPNGGAANSNYQMDWGIATDFFVPEDYDGDGSDDITVWRPDPAGSTFYVLQSSNMTFLAAQFGREGDNPTVVGDYDGDGKTDFAVYRAGALDGVSAWYYRPSGTPGANFTTVYWGQTGDFPVPGDFDGDGKNDFVVQRNNGGGQGIFFLNLSGGGTEAIPFGTSTDLVAPGDYDGDGKDDKCVLRGSGGQIIWNVLERDGGTQAYVFGASATDIPAPGDYTGDGRMDIAVWRPEATGQLTFFNVRPSGTTGAADFSVEWGQQGDYPVANYNVH